jgi:hypothetical protein
LYIAIHKILYDVICLPLKHKHGHKSTKTTPTLCFLQTLFRTREVTIKKKHHTIAMGLPQQPAQPAQPANDAPPSSVPTHAGDLPPAALELAGKLFDFARQGRTDELAQYVSA